MKILKENRLDLDWLLGVIGVKNNWISKEEFLSSIKSFNGEEDFYTGLYLADDLTNEKFVNMILEKFNFSSSQLQLGELVWQLLFLKRIKESNVSIHRKLNEIAALWASFKYTKGWDKFINYMPVSDDSQILGEENLYNNFLEFYNQNSSEVKKYGYAI